MQRRLNWWRPSLAAAVGVGVIWLVSLLPDPASAGGARLLHLVAVAFIVAGLVRQCRATSDAQLRRALMFFVASFSTGLLAASVAVGYVIAVGDVPAVSLVDLVVLAAVPLGVVGWCVMPSPDGRRALTGRVVADATVAAMGLAYAGWLVVVQPTVRSGNWQGADLAVMITYPVAYMFFAAMALSTLPRARAEVRPLLNCFVFGLLLLTLATSEKARELVVSGKPASDWATMTTQAGLMVIAVGAWTRPRQPDPRYLRILERVDTVVPLIPVAAAITASLHHVLAGRQFDLFSVLLACLTLALLSTRQLLYVRELRAVADENRHAAAHDELTGLANRKAFLAALSESLCSRGREQIVVLLADLDGFKEVNDTLGHQCGDAALVRFAEAIGSASPTHTAARLGGDEFAVLVAGDRAEHEARKLAELISSTAIPGVDRGVITCSVGIAAAMDGDRPAEVLRRADLAMYTAKRGGSPRVAVFTPAMAAHAERNKLLVAGLASAVESGEMRLEYQPLYGLNDGELAGAEVLLRWTHPLFGQVGPDEFIPLAENSGDIVNIGRWVLDTALEQVSRWRNEGRELPRVFVNVAAVQFTDDFAAHVGVLLRRHGVAPEQLTLEVTERQLPHLTLNVAAQELRHAGVRLALDDFGAGYSSLAQLARLPVDTLKIDSEFVRNLDTATGPQLVHVIVQLAKSLGLSTVAEGIENLGQAADLTNLGVDLAQGYLFSRSVPPEHLTTLLPILSGAAGTRSV